MRHIKPKKLGETHISSTAVCRSLRISGLDRESTLGLTNLIMKWTRSSGEEWTVNRLKTIKVFYLQSLASGQATKPEWVRFNRDNFPKGFSRVFKLRKPQKVLSALMCYTTYVAKSPTKAQLDKFVSSVVAPEKGFDLENLIRNIVGPRKELSPLPLTVPFLTGAGDASILRKGYLRGFWSSDRQSRRNIRVPQFIGQYDMYTGYYIPSVRSVPMSIGIQASTAGYHPALRRWLKHQPPVSDKDIWVLKEIDRMVGPVPYQDTHERRVGYFPVGTIGFIQEPGYKLRAVANPLPTLQLGLSRLGQRFKEYLRTIPQDCTFDQMRGVYDVQEKLKEGLEIASIDLSDATNLFPYSLTREIVSRLVPGILKQDLELWDEVVRGVWLMPDRSEIRWSTGQPLGVYPSFFGFAISHHMLCQSISPEFYRILGDDIVIDRRSGDRLKDLYREIGCKISDSKTINSSLMAEFAGKIILPDRILIQPKFRSFSDRNFIDYVQNLGPRAIGFLRPRQQKVIKPFLEMPRDLHPLACGFNPKGKSYNQRVKEAEPVLQALAKDDSEVFFTQLGVDLSELSWVIKLRSERPEIAQGLIYQRPCEEKDESSMDEIGARADPGNIQMVDKPQELSITKDSEQKSSETPHPVDEPDYIRKWVDEPTDEYMKLREKINFNLEDPKEIIKRIHITSGHTRLELDGPVPGLASSPVALEPSDPRGNTTLTVLERKLSKMAVPNGEDHVVGESPARPSKDSSDTVTVSTRTVSPVRRRISRSRSSDLER